VLTKNNILIACREFGLPSEVWMQRQSKAFQRLSSEFICWKNNCKDPSFSVTDLDKDFDSQENDRLRWLGRLVRAPSGNLLSATASEAKTIIESCRSHRPEAILCHYGQVALRMLPIAERLKIPLIAHFHGNDISSSLNNKYYRWSLRQSLKKFAACVAVGSRQIEILRSLGAPDAHVHLIPCGAPAQLFTVKQNYNSDKCRFITVSRLVPWKGVDIVLQAFCELYRENPNIELHIIGIGQLMEKLRSIRESEPAKNAIFIHGAMDEKSIHRMLLESDVFIQHSLDYPTGWFEGFGVSITEASLTGLPVIVTPSGGISDQIINGYNGLYVEQSSVLSTKNAMSKLAKSLELRKELGNNGRVHAEKKFDSNQLAHKLEDLILDKIKSPSVLSVEVSA